MSHPYPPAPQPDPEPREARAAQMTRESLAGDLEALAAYLRRNKTAPLPGYPVLHIRVPGRTQAEKLAALGTLAARMWTEEFRLPDGTRTAEIVFGSLTYSATVRAEQEPEISPERLALAQSAVAAGSRAAA